MVSITNGKARVHNMQLGWSQITLPSLSPYLSGAKVWGHPLTGLLRPLALLRLRCWFVRMWLHPSHNCTSTWSLELGHTELETVYKIMQQQALEARPALLLDSKTGESSGASTVIFLED